MFQPGDIVECLSSEPHHGGARVEKGSVYTIRECFPHPACGELTGLPAVYLAGIALPFNITQGMEFAWRASTFRLLKRRDPELIRKLLSEPEPIDLVAA